MATETVSEPLCSDYCWLVVKRLNINKYILLECIKDYKLHYRYSELFFFFFFSNSVAVPDFVQIHETYSITRKSFWVRKDFSACVHWKKITGTSSSLNTQFHHTEKLE